MADAGYDAYVEELERRNRQRAGLLTRASEGFDSPTDALTYSLDAQQHAMDQAQPLDPYQFSSLMDPLAREAADRRVAQDMAQRQARKSLDDIMAAQMAGAASQRGGPVGAIQQALGQQANAARLGVAQEAGVMEGQLALEQQRMNDEMVQYYRSLGFSVDEANRQANIEMQRIDMERALGNRALDIQQQQSDYQLAGSVMSGGGSLLSSVPGLVSMSDENVKENIEPADELIEEMMGNMKAYSYDYKEDKHGGKKMLGVMAQDLEKSEAGREMVIETTDGKAVDYGRMLVASMAALANIHKRLKGAGV